MNPQLITAKKWNDKKVLKEIQTLLANWKAVEHGGENNKEELRILKNIMKCKRDVCSVRVWLQHAFQPSKPEPDLQLVKIYLDFFSKLGIDDDEALRYLNAERGRLGLGQFLDTAQSRIVPPPIQRLAPNMRFTRTIPVAKALLPISVKIDETKGTTKSLILSSVRPSVESQPQNLEVAMQLNELGSSSAEKSAGISVPKSKDISEETVYSTKSEGETLISQNSEEYHGEISNLQNVADNIPFGATHEADIEVNLGRKRKRLVHDMLHIRNDLPDPEGCLDQTLVDQVPSNEPSRTTKRLKVNHPLIISMPDYESCSLPFDSSSVSMAVPCIPQGNPDEEARGQSLAICTAKVPNKHAKGEHPAQSSRPKGVGPDTHPLEDELEGRQQAQDRQLDSKPQSSMAVLGSEGPREISSFHANSVSREDFEKMKTSSNTDLVQSSPKAELPLLPPIWAESRQEVCEAFDWFRSYQGGVYHTDNTVKGYLLSAFASKRDVFENDGRLIISHGGGKSESIGSQKGLFVSHQASDQQADDRSVRALLDNYRSGRPLVLMVDDKYALFPYDLSSKHVTYAVLGFYSIVYAWAEFQTAKNEVGRIIRFKFAFRWCEEQGTPWWCFTDKTAKTPKEVSRDNEKASSVPRIISEDDFSRKSLLPKSNLKTPRLCSFCGSSSHQVYSIWVCLMPNCKMFWKNPETMEYAPDNLEYDKQFVTLSQRLALPSGLNLVPETTVTRARNGTSTSYAFTRGIHCPRCGRLSSRYQWEQLECRACKKWEKKADICIRSADFWCGRLPISFEFFQMSAVSDFIPEPIRSFKHEGGKGVIQTFTLPYNRGHIHHIRTSSAAGMLQANKIFRNYQEEAKSGKLKFRRWPLKSHKCRGTLLTNYFSHNAGEPYQYVGSDANTVPFEQVPAVIEARQLIQDRIQQSLDRISEFNEVLSCAYMERQKMAFHSDAEVGLGPLVAGLSLGSPALMHFRIAARHDPLYERRGVLLSLVLRHGDILVMDSNDVQEYYEHTVIPDNFRIAATARQITPRHHRQDIPS